MTTYRDTEDFVGATFVDASFRGARMREADLRGLTVRSSLLEIGRAHV